MENQTTVRNYLRKNNISQVVLFDCGSVHGAYLKLSPSNPTADVPHVFVIDQKGWIQEDYGYNLLNRGIFEGEDLTPIVEKYISRIPLAQADAPAEPRP